MFLAFPVSFQGARCMSRLPRLTALSFLVAALCLAAAAGCGAKFGNVSGDVRFKGQALFKGTIGFVPAEKGKQPVVGLIENGKYAVAGVPIGDVQVTVVAIAKPEIGRA